MNRSESAVMGLKLINRKSDEDFMNMLGFKDHLLKLSTVALTCFHVGQTGIGA